MRLDFSQEDLNALAKTLAPEVAKELKALLRPQGQDGNVIFTVKTLAEHLHVPESKIYNMVHLKEIPYVKVGRALRFRKSDIDYWMEDSYTPVNGILKHIGGGAIK